MSHIYALDKLMEQTRKLAADYYQTTGQVLPVSGELARYDAARLLHVTLPMESEAGVDAIGTGPFSGQKLQIKSRVLFREDRNNYRIGEFNLAGGWQQTVIVLFNVDYQVNEIYMASRKEIEESLAEKISSNNRKRGAMSLARFKAIGQLIWPI